MTVGRNPAVFLLDKRKVVICNTISLLLNVDPLRFRNTLQTTIGPVAALSRYSLSVLAQKAVAP
ncbi:hypothetical protein [Brevibacillus sp. VP]|uniref:hypothetical protein n=1 Tax=Brevibacillus sp. VP TaxID=2293326 RepID=UPI0011C074F1|nr:hypothetical protein [Brevibacillus sp. VP]